MTTDLIIRFPSAPPIGVTVWLDGQPYEIVAVEPYTDRSGVESNLIRWRAPCADCGQAFEVTSGRTLKSPNRRCEYHRRPGLAVTRAGGGG